MQVVVPTRHAKMEQRHKMTTRRSHCVLILRTYVRYDMMSSRRRYAVAAHTHTLTD